MIRLYHHRVCSLYILLGLFAVVSVSSDPAIANDPEFIVRSINLWNGKYYPTRQARIADLVYRNGLGAGHKHSPGIIGLQELRGKNGMTNCQASALRDRKPNAAKCFAGLLADRYKRPVHSASRSIVFGNDWKLILGATMRIGPGRVAREAWGTNYDRDLDEALLVHRTSGMKVRLYNTHFWPGGNEKKWVRKAQANDLVKLVRQRAQYGELPPILVGDFNYTSSEESERIIGRIFSVAARDSIDVVYVGRPTTFTKAHGKITVKDPSRTIPLTKYRYRSTTLSDVHNSPGVVLRLSKCACNSGQTRRCPSNSRAIQKCDGCNYTGVCWSTGSHPPGRIPGGKRPKEPRIPRGGDPW